MANPPGMIDERIAALQKMCVGALQKVDKANDKANALAVRVTEMEVDVTRIAAYFNAVRSEMDEHRITALERQQHKDGTKGDAE